VLAREDVPGDKRLVAYVVPESGVELSVSVLRDELSTALADYMVPSAYVVLPVLPLMPNGKLDRQALPAPDGSAVASRAYEAPMGEVEEAIAQIWQELLGLEQVGRHDRFFELGGHSLLALQVVARMHEIFKVEMSLMDIFENMTMAELAMSVGATQLSVYSQEDVSRFTAEIEELSDAELIRIWQEEKQKDRVEN
jgi:acyl carrier protein